MCLFLLLVRAFVLSSNALGIGTEAHSTWTFLTLPSLAFSPFIIVAAGSASSIIVEVAAVAIVLVAGTTVITHVIIVIVIYRPCR